MTDFCYTRPMLNRVFAQVALMDGMMERVGADPVAAAREEAGMAWYEARTKCIGCCSGALCRAWLARARWPAQPPAFCHNADFLRRCSEPPGSRPQRRGTSPVEHGGAR